MRRPADSKPSRSQEPCHPNPRPEHKAARRRPLRGGSLVGRDELEDELELEVENLSGDA